MAALGLWAGWLTLAADGAPAEAAGPRRTSLLAAFREGPLKEVASVVFAARGVNPTDGHWYANFGYYSHDPDRKAYAKGTKLYRLHLETRQLTPLLTDPAGGVRDPQVSYDAKKTSSAIVPAAPSSITSTRSSPTARA